MTDSYHPVGNGSYTGEACTFCGSQTFLYEGFSPECLPCFVAREKAVMAAESVGCGLTQLLGVVRELTPESKRTLLSDVLCWRVQLETVLSECQR